MKLALVHIFSVLLLALTGCSGSSEPTSSAALAKCYATEFGVGPPASVTNLQAKQVIVGDAGGAWLRFEADSNTVTQLISGRFTPSDHAMFENTSGGGNTPSWWNPEADSLTAFYVNNQWRKGSNYSVAVLAHDSARHVVYFSHRISF